MNSMHREYRRILNNHYSTVVPHIHSVAAGHITSNSYTVVTPSHRRP